MSYAPAKLVLDAVAALDGTSPLALVTFPALLKAGRVAGVDVTSTTVPFGASDETSLLDSYYRIPRPPDIGSPYFSPWTSGSWSKRRYAETTAQRTRTDLVGRGQVLIQDTSAGRNNHRWGLTATAGADLGLAKPGFNPTRLADLAIWFGRDVDVDALPASVTGGATDNVERLLAWFKSEFDPDKGDLIGTAFVDGVPPEYAGVTFAPSPIDDATYQILGSLPPAPVVASTAKDLVVKLEASLTDAGYELPKGLVRRVLSAWTRGDLVILVGQPGTGKSMFASLLGEALTTELDLDAPLVVPIRADYDEAEFIGYERLNGDPEYREFTKQVLETDEPLEARVVILEEFNLAPIETYLSAVLVASQDRSRLVRLPAGGQATLPIDTFFIATCNSYRDEPETRMRVSSPAKRRSTVITMPNVLGDRFDAEGDAAIIEIALVQIKNERERVQDRVDRGEGAQFDSIRLAALNTVTTASDLTDKARQTLASIGSAILDTSTGRSWFTIGLLRDVALALANADRDETSEMTALGEAVADKLVHQLRGSTSDTEDFTKACGDLPNADEIGRLLDRMTDGASGDLIPLL